MCRLGDAVLFGAPSWAGVKSLCGEEASGNISMVPAGQTESPRRFWNTARRQLFLYKNLAGRRANRATQQSQLSGLLWVTCAPRNGLLTHLFPGTSFPLTCSLGMAS